MATEYYIVKPNKKEIFYLGKRISYLDGIPNTDHKIEPEYPTWECWEDALFDLESNNRSNFITPELTVGQVWDFCYALYEFCDDKVYLDNDCSSNFNVWKDWKETDVFEQIFETTELEKWSELFLLVPENEWVHEKNSNIILEYETVRNYLQKLKEGTL